jgi:hypothetical protein
MPQPGYNGLKDPIPLTLRKSIAVYEAGKALVAYITPEYDEIARVSVCPYNMVTGKAMSDVHDVLLIIRHGFDPSLHSSASVAGCMAGFFKMQQQSWLPGHGIHSCYCRTLT